MFPQNIFLINNDDMNPYVGKGDLVIFEPIQMNKQFASSVYLIDYKGKQMIARVQLLVLGGMRLLFDSDRSKTIELNQSEQQQVIFIGHITARVHKDRRVSKGYSLYSNSLS